jgi:hypothetical protein
MAAQDDEAYGRAMMSSPRSPDPEPHRAPISLIALVLIPVLTGVSTKMKTTFTTIQTALK